MNNLSRFALSLATLVSLQASAMDMAAMEKWGNAKVVKYRVEGVHSARTSVVHGDYEGKAEVIDHITVEFTWDIKKSRFVGLAKGGPISVSADGKSFSMKGAENWTWTYTPTILQ